MKLWEKGTIGAMELDNRVVRSATNEHLTGRDGRVTAAYLEVYETLARSGAGLILTGHMTVDGRGRADGTQICLDAPGAEEELARLARVIHQAGGKAAVQISHGGLKAPAAVNGRPGRGPSAVDGGEEMSPAEIAALPKQFARGARLAQAAGFDGVQLHLAHGYLLSEFLDPYYNRRTDSYGGSAENRRRIVEEVVAAVRAACGPAFPLLVKINATDVEDTPGFLEDQIALCRRLETLGVDAVEVSGHGFNTLRRQGPYFLPHTLAIRRAVSIPVLAVGGLRAPEEMEAVLGQGADFISLSRPFIAQPELMDDLRRGEKSKCVSCNSCYKIYRTQFKRCALHRGEVPQLRALFGEDTP